jgi:hypothetical protein
MKRKSKTALILILTALIVLLLIRSCPKKLATPPPKSAPAAVSKPTPPNVKPHSVVDERQRIVDNYLKKNRFAIAACLAKSDRQKVTAAQLTMTFDPTGRLAHLNLAPDMGKTCLDCLTQLISGWTVPVASDLAPLAVSKKLRLRLQ